MSDKTSKEWFLEEILKDCGITFYQYKQLGKKITKLIVDECPNIRSYHLVELVKHIGLDLRAIDKYADEKLREEMNKVRDIKLDELRGEYILGILSTEAENIFKEK